MNKSILNEIVDLTGLPKEALTKELLQLIQSKGLSEEGLTLDHLRCVLAEYLQDIILEAKEEFK